MVTVTAKQFFGGKIPPPPADTSIHTPEKSVSTPSYGDQVTQAAKSGADKIQQGFNEAADGKMPIEPALKIGAGAVEAASAPLTPLFSPIGKFIGYVSDKLGDHPAVQKFAMSPAGEATQRVAEDVGNATEIAGAVAGGPKVAPAAGAVIDTATAAPRAAVASTGTLLKTAGEKATGLAVGMEEPTKIALQNYEAAKPTLIERVSGYLGGDKPAPGAAKKPTTEANTAVRLLQPGTEWQLGVNAKRVSSKLWQNTIQPALDASKNVNDMKTLVSTIRSRIIKETADLDRRNTLLKALSSFADDYKNVRTFSDSKLQQYKEGWAQFLPDKTYKGEPIAAAAKQVRAIAADEARKVLYKVLPDDAAKQAYIDYGNLRSISEAGIKSVDPLRSKGFTKQAWEFLLDKAVTPVATIGGKVLYKTGQGLEFIGGKGARKVRDIVQPR